VTAAAALGAPLRRCHRTVAPLDLLVGLAPLRRGSADPSLRVVDGAVWRTTRTPDGPATVRLEAVGDRVEALAWGPGAGWVLEQLPELLGDRDDGSGFVAHHPLVARMHRLHPGLFLPRTGRVLEALVPAVLEQKVTGVEARLSWRQLLGRFGDPAPGPAPAGMAVPPSAAGWLALASWDWHRAGVDGARVRTIRAAAAVAGSLERLTCWADPAAVSSALRSLPGIGAWTAAETAQRAFGDADAVSVGDFHLPSQVGYALAGRTRTDDAGMLALLACYRPQRQRAVRLIGLAGLGAPRFGPRAPVRSYRGC
jgi:3-methyladenine DNA glycosylase/8-oxoguanine DNA glycosylase